MLLRYVSFSDVYIEKQLDIKAKVIFRIYDVSEWITKYTLPNISRSKGKQTAKFGQLIEYNISFLKNHTQNVAEKLVPDPFIKNQNCSYLWIINLKCYAVFLDFRSKLRSTKI